MSLDQFRSYLRQLEGGVPTMYRDTRGNATFGYGSLATEEEEELYPVGSDVPQDLIDRRFLADSEEAFLNAEMQGRDFPGEMTPELLATLGQANYQLGNNWLDEHTNTRDLLRSGDWSGASRELENSEWFKQTPNRVQELQYGLGTMGQAPAEPDYSGVYIPDPYPKKPESSVFDAFTSSAQRSLSNIVPGLQAAYADMTGDEELYRSATQELRSNNEAAAMAAPGLVSLDEIGETYDKDGLFPAAAKVVEFGGEQISQSVGFRVPAMGLALGAAGVAAALPVAIGPGIAASVAGLGGAFAGYLADTINRAEESGAATTEDLDLLKVIAASGGQTVLDSLGYGLVGGGALLRGGFTPLLTGDGRRVALSAVHDALTRFGNLSVGKRIGATLLEEEVAELGQTALERYAAGLEISPLEEQAMNEYVEIALSTLPAAIGFSGIGSGVNAYSNHRLKAMEGRVQEEKGLQVAETQRILEQADQDARQREEMAGLPAINRELEDLRFVIGPDLSVRLDDLAEVDAQEDVSPVMREVVESQGEESAAIAAEYFTARRDLNVARAEAERASELSGQGAPTTEDIHRVADDRGIAWDDDPSFMAATYRHTGKWHLDDVPDTPKGRKDLKSLYEYISGLERQDVKRPLLFADEKQVVKFVRELKKIGGERKTEYGFDDVKKALGIGVETKDAVAKEIARGFADRAAGLGYLQVEKGNKYSVARRAPLPRGVSASLYLSVMEMTRANDVFPTREQFATLGVRSERAIKEIERVALERGDVVRGRRTRAGRYESDGALGFFPGSEKSIYPSDRLAGEESVVLRKDGKVVRKRDKGKFVEDKRTPQELEDAVDKIFRENRERLDKETEVYQVDFQNRSLERRLDVHGRASDRGDVDPVDVDIERVDTPGGVVGVSSEVFRVSRSARDANKSPWVVRNSSGGIEKFFASKSKAQSWLNEKQKGFGFYVDGGLKGQFRTRTEANKARAEWEASEGKAQAESSIPAGTRGRAAKVKKAVKDRWSIDPANVVELSKPERLGDGYVIREYEVSEDGSFRSSKPVEFHTTLEGARGAKERRDRERIGREAAGGELLPPGDAQFIQQVRDPEVGPGAALASRKEALVSGLEQKRLARQEARETLTPEQKEAFSSLEQRLGSILKSQGLDQRVLLKLVKGLSVTEDGRTPADFTSAARLIQIAADPGFEAKDLDSKVAALRPYLNHETFHALSQMDVISASERKELTRYAEKTPVPERLLPQRRAEFEEKLKALLDEGQMSRENFDKAMRRAGEVFRPGVTYMDIANALYSRRNIGDRGVAEEAFAMASEDYDRTRNPSPAGKPVNKVARFMTRLGRAVRGRNKETAEEIFEKLYGGEFGDRVREGKILDTWWIDNMGSPEFAELEAWSNAQGRGLPFGNLQDRIRPRVEAEPEEAEQARIRREEGERARTGRPAARDATRRAGGEDFNRDYFAVVNSGDMDLAQMMIDAAAKAEGYEKRGNVYVPKEATRGDLGSSEPADPVVYDESGNIVPITQRFYRDSAARRMAGGDIRPDAPIVFEGPDPSSSQLGPGVGRFILNKVVDRDKIEQFQRSPTMENRIKIQDQLRERIRDGLFVGSEVSLEYESQFPGARRVIRPVPIPEGEYRDPGKIIGVAGPREASPASFENLADRLGIRILEEQDLIERRGSLPGYEEGRGEESSRFYTVDPGITPEVLAIERVRVVPYDGTGDAPDAYTNGYVSRGVLANPDHHAHDMVVEYGPWTIDRPIENAIDELASGLSTPPATRRAGGEGDLVGEVQRAFDVPREQAEAIVALQNAMGINPGPIYLRGGSPGTGLRQSKTSTPGQQLGVFYSKLAESLREIRHGSGKRRGQEKVPPLELKARLKKMGVKDEELAWSTVGSFLDAAADSGLKTVSLDDVINNSRPVELRRVILSDGPAGPDFDRDAAEEQEMESLAYAYEVMPMGPRFVEGTGEFFATAEEAAIRAGSLNLDVRESSDPDDEFASYEVAIWDNGDDRDGYTVHRFEDRWSWGLYGEYSDNGLFATEDAAESDRDTYLSNEISNMSDGELKESTGWEEYQESARQDLLGALSDSIDGPTEYSSYRASHSPSAPDKLQESEVPGSYKEILLTWGNKPSGVTDEADHFGWEDVLVHARVVDLDMDGNKVLWIDEVQSDWSQENRRRGIKSEGLWHVARTGFGNDFGGTRWWSLPDEDAPGRSAASERSWGLFDDDGQLVSTHASSSSALAAGERADSPEAGDIDVKLESPLVRLPLDNLDHPETFWKMDLASPNPLMSNWVDVMTKKLIAFAAAEGYDEVAWTPAELQKNNYHSQLSSVITGAEWSEDIRHRLPTPEEFAAYQRFRTDRMFEVLARDPADISESAYQVHYDNIREGLPPSVPGRESSPDLGGMPVFHQLEPGGRYVVLPFADSAPEVEYRRGAIEREVLVLGVDPSGVVRIAEVFERYPGDDRVAGRDPRVLFPAGRKSNELHQKLINQDLSKVIGSSAADRILSKGSGKMDVDEIVGGNKLFDMVYDNQMVKSANKLGKKFGAKVRTDGKPVPKPSKEEMGKRYDLKKNPETGEWDIARDGRLKVPVSAYGRAVPWVKDLGPGYRNDKDTMQKVMEDLVSSEHAFVMRRWSDDPLGEAVASGKKIAGYPAFPITEKLRESLDENLIPLYQSKIDPQASVEFAGDGAAIIRGFKGSDVTSGVHELAHVARRRLFDRDVPAENRSGITDEEIQTVEDWAGVTDGVWIVKAEEKFARGFERYIQTGRAPNKDLMSLFKKLSDWFAKIYRSMVGAELSPEMTAVFDKLVQRGSSSAVSPAARPATRRAGGDATEVASALDGKSPRRLVKLLKDYPGSIIANRFAEGFEDQGFANLLGQKINEPIDLAILGQVYRNPGMETFRVFYMRGDEVVGQTATTSRLPNAVAFEPLEMVGQETPGRGQIQDYIKEDMERLGADGFWLLHNHPSGKPKPSLADKLLTHLIFRKTGGDRGSGFRGHVVVNQNQYGHIDRFGEPSIHDLPGEGQVADTYDVDRHSVPHVLIGMPLRSLDQVAEIGHRLSHDQGDYFQIVSTDVDSAITGIMDVPAGLMEAISSARRPSLMNFVEGGDPLPTAGDASGLSIDNLRLAAVLRKFLQQTAGRSLFAMNVNPDHKHLFLGTEGKPASEAFSLVLTSDGEFLVNRGGKGHLGIDAKAIPVLDESGSRLVTRKAGGSLADADLFPTLQSSGVGVEPDFFWGQVLSGGKKGPGRRGVPVVVQSGNYGEDPVTGQTLGYGAARMDRNEEGIQQNTPYTSWKELLPAFLERLGNARIGPDSAEIVPDGPTDQDKVRYIWKAEGWEKPAVITMRRGDFDGRKVWSAENVYSTGNIYADPEFAYQSEGGAPRWGNEASADAVRIALRPDLFPLQRQQSVRSRKSRLPQMATRQAAGVFPEGMSSAERNAQQQIMGPNVPRKTFFEATLGTLKSIDSDWMQRVSRQLFDKYERIYRIGQNAVDQRIAARHLASTTAHSNALNIDNAHAYVASMMDTGGITNQFGVTMVDPLDLENTIPAGTVAVGVNEDGSIRMNEEPINAGKYSGTGGLMQILAPLVGNNLDDTLWAYEKAVRAHRLRGEGRRISFTDTPGQTDDLIRQAIETAQKYPEVLAAHHNLQRWNNMTLDFLETAGFPPELIRSWKKNNDYIPFYLDNDPEVVEAFKNVVKADIGDNRSWTAIDRILTGIPGKKLKGGKGAYPMVDPLEAISKNAMMLVTAGLKNIATNMALDDASTVKDRSGVTLAEKSTKKDPESIRVFRNGNEEYWKVEDPLLHATLTGVFRPKDQSFQQVEDVLGKPARWLRESVTRSPEFMLANMMRDSLAVWAQGGDVGIPLVGTLSTFSKQLATGPSSFRTSGGTEISPVRILERTGTIGGYEFSSVEKGTLNRKMRRAMGDKSGNSISRGPMYFWDKAGDWSSVAEASTRQRVFENVFNEVYGELGNLEEAERVRRAIGEASHQAREILNFNRKGANPFVQLASIAIPFLNARIQGLHRLGRAFTRGELVGKTIDPKTAAVIALRRGLAISAATVAYTALLGDDDELDKIRPEVRDDYWLLPLFGEEFKFFALPIPFEIGILFKVIPEHFTRQAMGEATSRDSWKSLSHALFSTMNVSPPALFKPLAENYVNYNLFTGENIVPFYMEGWGGNAYRPTTSESMKMIGRSTGISPLKYENMVRGHLGQLGMYGVSVVDAGLQAFGMTDFKKPEPRLTDFPFFRRFLQDNQESGLASTFYALREESDSIVAQVNSLMKTEPERGIALRDENQELLAVRDYINETERYLKDIRDQEIMVYTNQYMSPSEKRQMMDALAEQKNWVLRTAPLMASVVDEGFGSGSYVPQDSYGTMAEQQQSEYELLQKKQEEEYEKLFKNQYGLGSISK